MPPFARPTFRYTWDVERELAALRAYPTLPEKSDRAIPAKSDDRLLVATWNIANLGVQERREKDYRLLAEIVGWFDLIAIQEVNNNLKGLRALLKLLPGNYRALFNDAGGNDERFAFVYDADKVALQEEIGELTIPAADLASIKLPDIPAAFVGFDRNPMIASFKAGRTVLLLASVHLYFGKSHGTAMDRRVLEAFAVAWWADKRYGNRRAYTSKVIALGDFNLPKQVAGDRVHDALTAKGLKLPKHSTKIGSNIRNDANYDQMAVLPGRLERAIKQFGIFDFDGAVFRTLWGTGTNAEKQRFFSYVQYYLSDHRPLWMALDIT
jgi:endonuclease/exonuclease/phosphatase family metal-dependent hydrolase